jgi:hypothetical protein
VSPLVRPSWSLFFEEFHCRGCGAEDAYQSRPRGFFESYLLPILFLQPVRCDHCYLRSYIPRSVTARERTRPPRKQPESQPAPEVQADSRIA